MACNLSAGYGLDSFCRDSVGGIQKVYIGNFTSNATYDLDGNNEITGVTSGATYYTFDTAKETGEFNETLQASIENGTLFYEQTLGLVFHKNSSTLRDSLLVLAQAKLTVIVLDQNGVYWLLGKINGCDTTEGTRGFGKAYGDLNGFTINVVGKEPLPAFLISAAGFATLTITAN